MKLTKPTEHDPHYYLNITDKCFIHVRNEWSQLCGKYNWYSFTFCQIYFEDEKMTGGWEFEFMLLGLGFRVRYNYAFEQSEAGQRLKELDKKKE